MVTSKNALLPISNCTSRNFLRSLGAKNKDLGFALQMFLDRDTLNLQQRLKRLNGAEGVKKKERWDCYKHYSEPNRPGKKEGLPC